MIASIRCLVMSLSTSALLVTGGTCCLAQCIEIRVGEYRGAPGEVISMPIETPDDLTGLDVFAARVTTSFPSSLLQVVDVRLTGTIAEGYVHLWQTRDLGNGLEIVEVVIAGTEPLVGSGDLVDVVYAIAGGAQEGQQTPLWVSGAVNEGDPCVEERDGSFLVETIPVGIQDGDAALPAGELQVVNPVSGQLLLRRLGLIREPRVELFDPLGRRVASWIPIRASRGGETLLELPVGASGGRYFLRVTGRAIPPQVFPVTVLR